MRVGLLESYDLMLFYGVINKVWRYHGIMDHYVIDK